MRESHCAAANSVTSLVTLELAGPVTDQSCLDRVVFRRGTGHTQAAPRTERGGDAQLFNVAVRRFAVLAMQRQSDRAPASGPAMGGAVTMLSLTRQQSQPRRCRPSRSSARPALARVARGLGVIEPKVSSSHGGAGNIDGQFARPSNRRATCFIAPGLPRPECVANDRRDDG